MCTSCKQYDNCTIIGKEYNITFFHIEKEDKNMLRKHNAAYRQKCCTHKNTAVNDCLHNVERTVRALQLHDDFPVYLTAVACCAGLGNIAERKVCTDKRL